MTGKICGTGSWAPDRVWDNNDLAKMVETSDQWIRERSSFTASGTLLTAKLNTSFPFICM